MLPAPLSASMSPHSWIARSIFDLAVSKAGYRGRSRVKKLKIMRDFISYQVWETGRQELGL